MRQRLAVLYNLCVHRQYCRKSVVNEVKMYIQCYCHFISKMLLLKEKIFPAIGRGNLKFVFSPSINCFQIYSPPEQVSSSNTHE